MTVIAFMLSNTTLPVLFGCKVAVISKRKESLHTLSIGKYKQRIPKSQNTCESASDCII